MLCPIPTSGCGMSSRFWLIRCIRSLVWSHQLAGEKKRKKEKKNGVSCVLPTALAAPFFPVRVGREELDGPYGRCPESSRSRRPTGPGSTCRRSRWSGCARRSARRARAGRPTAARTVPSEVSRDGTSETTVRYPRQTAGTLLNDGWRASLTLGNPLAWAAMMVTSPGRGSGLSSGIYCLTASRGRSASPLAVAATYSREWWQSTVCCTTR